MKINRGQISIVILVVGVFVVCTFALISFFISSSYVKNSFIGVSLISEMKSEIETYFINPNSVTDFVYNSQGQKILYKEQIGKNKFLFGKKKILVSVQYILK